MHDVQRFLEMLRSPNASNRYDACEELRVAPWIPAEAIAALRTATQDSNPEVADAARRALELHMPTSSAPKPTESPPPIPEPMEAKDLATRPMMIAAYSPSPLSAEVFLLNPANKDFAEGRSHNIAPHSGAGTYAMAVVAVLMTFPCVVWWATDPSVRWPLLGLPGFVCLPLIGLVIRGLRHRRLTREGHLIKGEVVECSLELGSGEYKNLSFITLRYAFLTPQGSRLHGTEGLTKTVQEGRDLSLPQPGTPVAVLYADKGLFKLL